MRALEHRSNRPHAGFLFTGGLINPRPGHGQYRAGFSNTGGSPEPRKRAPCQKKYSNEVGLFCIGICRMPSVGYNDNKTSHTHILALSSILLVSPFFSD